MFENVLLFIHLKMFKIGCMLNVIYYNKLCIACCCVTQNNNSLGNIHVDHILLDQLGFHN